MEDKLFNHIDIGMSITQGCLIVPLTIDFYDEILHDVQQHLLEAVYENQAEGVIIDISRLKTANSYIFKMISDTVQMILLLGVPSVIVGIQPGVAATVVDLDINISDLCTMQTLEQGIEYLKKLQK